MRYLHCPKCRAKLAEIDGRAVTCDHAGRKIVASGDVTVHCHKTGCDGEIRVRGADVLANGQRPGQERILK